MLAFEKILLCIVFYCVFSKIFAQNIERLGAEDLRKDISIYDQTVVSASRSEKKIADLPVTIHVITKEQISQNGYKSLAEAMQEVPTVRVSRVGNGIEGEIFLVRGLRGNYYMKILLNGIPIAPSVALGMPIGEQLPIQQVERIEVITGAASAIYGADALGGVINIVTQNPEDNTITQAGTSTGQFGYFNNHFLVGSALDVGKAKKRTIEYTLWGNYSKQDDLNLPTNNNLWNPQNYNPDFVQGVPVYTPNYKGSNSRPEFSNIPRQAYSFGLNVRIGDFLITTSQMYRREHSSIGQETSSYFYYNPETFWGERVRQITGIYQKTLDRFSLTTNLSWLNYRLDKQSSFALVFEGGENGRQYKYAAADDVMAEQIITYKINPNFELTAGAIYQISGNLPKTNDLPRPIDTKAYRPFARSIDLSDPLFGKFGYNPIVYTNVGGFLQGYYSKSRLIAIAGLRYDIHSKYGDSFNPRLALLYKLTDKASLRSSWGTAFKAPTPNNSYNSIAIPVGGQILYLAVPNPQLKPENATNFEFGGRYQLSNKVNIEVVAYQNQIRRLIDARQTEIDPVLYPNSLTPTTVKYFNDDKAFALLRGIQLSLRASNLTKYKISSIFNLSYAKGEEELPQEKGRINAFREMPQWLGFWQFSFKLFKNVWIVCSNYFASNWYSRSIDAKEDYWESKFLIKGFYLMNLQANVDVSNNLILYGKITNVFNTVFAGAGAYGFGDLLYNPQPLRMMYLGISFSFK
ncbi:MAG: TonB-dependent receptor [Microscillaceae bacterium]|nr:TonB-dependent receptor [Microscillaceae bacterium]MDW8461323.1 TonB-dependent receptor [Cytophagales bacterium]